MAQCPRPPRLAGEHGDWCPGYHRPAHAAADLTVDHVVPLAAGGAPCDIANTAVLCPSCNSTKGATTEGGWPMRGLFPLTAPADVNQQVAPLIEYQSASTDLTTNESSGKRSGLSAKSSTV